MAESAQKCEEAPSCPLCSETFRKPVLLPCHHRFCKDCIDLFAHKSKFGQTEEGSSSNRSKDVNQLILCPVCREPTSLGREGESDLPVNIHLEEIVDRFPSAVKIDDDIPNCSVCEEDNPTKAVKFCTVCGILYCKDCLAAVHPMRGPLKRHRLISAQEYLTQERSQRELRDEQSTQQSSCTRHGRPFCLYCEPCQMVTCDGCVDEHRGHAMLDIPSAAEKGKSALLDQAAELEKVVEDTKETMSAYTKLHDKIKENQELHIQEVDRAYSAALEALQTWRQQSLDAIQIRDSQCNEE